MTQEGRPRDVYPPTPPGRPGFEFREAPSRRPERRNRPPLVAVAFALWLAAALVWLLATAVSLIEIDVLRVALLTIVDRDFPGETPETRDQVVTVTLAILVGGSALIALLQIWGAVAMRSGRGAARGALVLLTIVAGIYTLVVLSAAPLLIRVWLLVGLGVMVLAAVTMLLPAARPWFVGSRR